MSRGCLTGRPYPRDTRETQLPPFVLTLRIPVMCNAHASFCKKLSREISAKTSSIFSCLSLHTLSLSNTQPLQWNPTINTRYKRLNNIQSNFARNESQQNTYLKITTLHHFSAISPKISLSQSLFTHKSHSHKTKLPHHNQVSTPSLPRRLATLPLPFSSGLAPT